MHFDIIAIRIYRIGNTTDARNLF